LELQITVDKFVSVNKKGGIHFQNAALRDCDKGYSFQYKKYYSRESKNDPMIR
jgi:hypothetical protein